MSSQGRSSQGGVGGFVLCKTQGGARVGDFWIVPRVGAFCMQQRVIGNGVLGVQVFCYRKNVALRVGIPYIDRGGIPMSIGRSNNDS